MKASNPSSNQPSSNTTDTVFDVLYLLLRVFALKIIKPVLTLMLFDLPLFSASAVIMGVEKTIQEFVASKIVINGSIQTREKHGFMKEYLMLYKYCIK
jgi:hypothetical protein